MLMADKNAAKPDSGRSQSQSAAKLLSGRGKDAMSTDQNKQTQSILPTTVFFFCHSAKRCLPQGNFLSCFLFQWPLGRRRRAPTTSGQRCTGWPPSKSDKPWLFSWLDAQGVSVNMRVFGRYPVRVDRFQPRW